MGGSRGASLEVELPGVPPCLRRLFALGRSSFLLARGSLCRCAVAGAAEGVVSGSYGPVTSSLAGGGGLLGRECGGLSLLACVAWF